jgi:hypothetical protein
METHSRSKCTATSTSSNKINKRRDAVKDSIRVVAAPDTSGIKKKDDTTVIAVPTSSSSKKIEY